MKFITEDMMGQELLNPAGEPCAVKVARTVRRGAVAKVPKWQLGGSLPNARARQFWHTCPP